MKNKIAIMLCITAMCAGLSSCGGKTKGDESGDTLVKATESSQESTKTEESTEEGTKESESEGSAESTGQIEEETTAVPGAEETGLSEEMQAIKTAVADALGDNYWPDTEIAPDILEGIFGITSDMYEDYMGEMPMISVNVDTLVVVKPKDGKADAVEEALESYRQSKVDSTMQYPSNVGKIQASRVERVGDYVCFVMLGGDISTAEEQGEDAVIKACQEQNELAIEVISKAVVK